MTAHIKEYPNGVIALATVNATFCFCDLAGELFKVTIVNQGWALWAILLSSIFLVAWGLAVKRFRFACLFFASLTMALFYLWIA